MDSETGEMMNFEKANQIAIGIAIVLIILLFYFFGAITMLSIWKEDCIKMGKHRDSDIVYYCSVEKVK